MALRRAVMFSALLWAAPPLWADNPTSYPIQGNSPTQGVLPLEDLRVFTKAYEHIRSAYINEIDDKTLLEYAIRGMLNELDPHSAYLDASSYGDLQIHTTGEFGGLGIEVGMEDGFVKVVSPIDDTPAARAGIEAGDLIVKIDDTAIKGLTLSEAVELMRGPKGSKIRLTVVRAGLEPFDLTLVRDVIKVASVRGELLEDRFAYVRVAQFQANTGRDLRKALTKLRSEGNIDGVVLDLRNNPGGLLQASVEVADLFLDGGMVVYTEGRLSHSNTEYKAEPGDMLAGLPMVVLINEGSASASEIVAGALQDHKRAVVMGTQSFGKGSVQTVIPITEDKAVKLTTALYFTPNGRSIQAEGIVPDITAERVTITAAAPQEVLREAHLAHHLDNAKAAEAEAKAQAEAVTDEIKEEEKEVAKAPLQERDSQLYQAVNLLKGLTILKGKAAPAAAKPSA